MTTLSLSNRHQGRAVMLVVVVITALLSIKSCLGFVVPSSSSSSSSYHYTRPPVVDASIRQSQLYATSNNNKNKNKNNESSSSSSSSSSSLKQKKRINNIADFEYQELRAQIEAMDQQHKRGTIIAGRDLKDDETKRNELEQYIQAVVEQRPSPIPLADIGRVLTASPGRYEWKLVYSTMKQQQQQQQQADMPPRDATVLLEFDNNDNDDNDKKPKQFNYILEFSKKTLGLHRLIAKSTYQVDIINHPGLVTFVYDEIKADMFGFSNIGGGGLFSFLLKGRVNYIESVYMDGRFWIEQRRRDEHNDKPYYNIYLKRRSHQ
jgi:hypothetical protein